VNDSRDTQNGDSLKRRHHVKEGVAYGAADPQIHSGSQPEEEGGFTVRVPSLPEIVTYGKDEAEALAMAEDAIRLVLEDSLARRGY
jgi:hypothetical protein